MFYSKESECPIRSKATSDFTYCSRETQWTLILAVADKNTFQNKYFLGP